MIMNETEFMMYHTWIFCSWHIVLVILSHKVSMYDTGIWFPIVIPFQVESSVCRRAGDEYETLSDDNKTNQNVHNSLSVFERELSSSLVDVRNSISSNAGNSIDYSSFFIPLPLDDRTIDLNTINFAICSVITSALVIPPTLFLRSEDNEISPCFFPIELNWKSI